MRRTRIVLHYEPEIVEKIELIKKLEASGGAIPKPPEGEGEEEEGEGEQELKLKKSGFPPGFTSESNPQPVQMQLQDILS